MYRLTVLVSSPLLIGGQSSSLLLDKITARDGQGRPYIPASALKGAMRIDFERLLRSWGYGHRVCSAPNPGAMQRSHVAMAQAGHSCLACSLFGGPAGPGTPAPSGKLRFYDATLADPDRWDPALYHRRTGVSISRSLRRAYPRRLFEVEGTPLGIELELGARITLLESLGAEEKEWFEKALGWWAEEGLWVGGARSRGMGRLRLRWTVEEEQASPPSPPPSRALFYRLIYRPFEEVRVSPPKPRPYFLKTYTFIPGTTVRGALASALKRRGVDGATLRELFLSRPFRLSHLYRGTFKMAKEILRPATAAECKREGHGPYDLLIWRFLLHLALERKPETVEGLWEKIDRCPQCPSKLDQAATFPVFDRHLSTKLALNRVLMRAEPGMFYVYETLPAVDGAVSFEGLIAADPVQPPHFAALNEVLLGGARSKGFGRGAVELRPLVGGDLGDRGRLLRREEDFNTCLRQAANDVGLVEALKGRRFMTLDLLTDLLLPPGQSLKALLTSDGFHWELAALRWTKLGGYHEAANRSKPLVSALEKGGVVLLSVAETDREKGMDLLLRYETEGLGLKKDEGFGWVQGCSPFHYQEVWRP